MKQIYKLEENRFYIDGFYYCISKEKPKVGDYSINRNSKHGHKELCRIDNEIELERYVNNKNNDCRKIVFTNNPSIPIPQLVIPDREDEVGWNTIYQQHGILLQDENSKLLFRKGYKANPNRWSDEDIEDYEKWKQGKCHLKDDGIWVYYETKPFSLVTTKDLLSIYIKSKAKIIESFEVEMECTQQDVNGDCTLYTIGCGDLCKPKLNSDNTITALNIKCKE